MGIGDKAEISAKTAASVGERTPERLCRRNGYRERRVDTRLPWTLAYYGSDAPPSKPHDGCAFGEANGLPPA